MKLRLTKSWYEKRAKAEEGCMDVAAGASVRPIQSDAEVKVKAQAKEAKKAGSRSTSALRVRSSRKNANN